MGPTFPSSDEGLLMQQNKIFYRFGTIGYFCQCGNAEEINDENYYYRLFRASVEKKGPNRTPLITCLACESVSEAIFSSLPPELTVPT